MPDKDVKREQDDVREARRDLRHEKHQGDNKGERKAENDLRREKGDVKDKRD